LGPYNKILDEKMREEWNKLPQSEKDKFGYERDLMDFLGRLVSDVDRKVNRGIARIENERRQARETQKRLLEKLEPEDRLNLKRILTKCEELDEKAVRLESIVRESESNNDDDKEKALDELYAVMSEITKLKKDQTAIEKKLGVGITLMGTSSTLASGTNKMILCRISGNFLSNVSSSHRLLSHFRGKQFKGWKLIREKYFELQQKRPPRGIPGYGPKRSDDDNDDERRRRSRDDRHDGRYSRDRDYSRRRRSRSRSRERGYSRRRRY
jgi:hypothetical protein